MIETNGNDVIFESGRTVTFDAPVAQIVLCEKEVVIILLDYLALRNNVCGYTRTGDRLWRIGPIPTPRDLAEAGYVGAFYEDGLVRLVAYESCHIWANPDTGEIVGQLCVKI